MNDFDSQLPENDRDARLAARIGIALEAGELDGFLSRPDTDLGRALSQYRSHETMASAVNADAVWQSIEQATIPRQNGRLRLIKFAPTNRLSIAASILLLCLVTAITLVLLRPGSETLIASAQNGTRTIALDDGTSIQLRQNSSLYRVVERENISRFRLEGEASFQVTHDETRVFEVQTDGGTISVLGTTFVVSTWGNETRVFLTDGSVQLSSFLNDDSVRLQPGQAAGIASDGLIETPADANEAEYRDWQSDQLVFKQTPISAVLAEFGHHFRTHLDVPDSIAAETITGTIDLRSFDGSLENLGIVLGGRFVAADDSHYEFTAQD